jgi:hypothetical protein
MQHLLALARDTHRTGVPLDLDQLVADTRDRWQNTFAAAERSLTIHRDEEAPPSRASAAAVGQIIDVLLDNALTHGRGAVTVTLREAAGALALDVADEGPGVSAGASPFTAARRAPPGTASAWRWPATSPRPRTAGFNCHAPPRRSSPCCSPPAPRLNTRTRRRSYHLDRADDAETAHSGRSEPLTATARRWPGSCTVPRPKVGSLSRDEGRLAATYQALAARAGRRGRRPPLAGGRRPVGSSGGL